MVAVQRLVVGAAASPAVVSPFVSPSPRKHRCRAEAWRNHNPRVGGSSPSSGMRKACNPTLSLAEDTANLFRVSGSRARVIWL
jgi:hypothetical protein